MRKDSPLYENIYIGAFIYALGVISGQKGHIETEAFSLIQQTPDDTLLADLFARWKGVNFIIEFKRARNQIKNELKKPLKRILLEKICDHEHLNYENNLNFINRCHFICFASNSNSKTELKFSPYSCVPKYAAGQKVEEIILTDFIGQIVSRQIGVSLSGLKAYFNILKSIANVVPSADVGGLIVNIDTNGNPNLIRFDNLNILEKSLHHIHEIGIERSLDRGPSLSM